MADDAAPSPPKKVKKLPFKPTALRKTAQLKLASSDDDTKEGGGGGGGGGDNDDGLALFRRSKEMEPIVAADRERKLKKKLKQEEERRRRASITMGKRRLEDEDEDDDVAPLGDVETQHERSPLGQWQDEPAQDVFTTDESLPIDDGSSHGDLVTPPASKRSRVESTPSKTPRQILTLEEADVFALDSPSTRVLRSHSKLATPIKSFQESGLTSGSAAVISLDSDHDDDDDDIIAISTPSRRPRDASIEVADDAPGQAEDDGDEFEEYVRKAEQQRARDRAMLGGGMDGTPELEKEKVDILVTSTVPNTGPCLIKFLFDRPLRQVRDNWIMLQRRKGAQLSLRQDDDLILTWRRKKVYTVSTLLNLGIRPQAGGHVQVEDHSQAGLRNRGTQVHMEAWTPELFQEMEREEELRRRREAGELSDSDDDAAGPPEPEVKLRVILKARSLDDVKLTVRPETTVETLVTGFRAQRGVGSDKDVGLYFDGDRLEEHVTMADAEIDDMDTFEVHIR